MSVEQPDSSEVDKTTKPSEIPASTYVKYVDGVPVVCHRFPYDSVAASGHNQDPELQKLRDWETRMAAITRLVKDTDDSLY